MSQTVKNKVNFWFWFWRGTGSRPGAVRIVNRFLLIDLVIGLFAAHFRTKGLEDISGTVLLPLAAVLIGIAFAWSGSAQSLLQTDEIVSVSRHVKGGFHEYVYLFQLAILTVLSTCVAWGIAALGVFEPLLSHHHPDAYFVVCTVLLGATSLCIRECWSMIHFSQAMLIMRETVQRTRNQLLNPPTSIIDNEHIETKAENSVSTSSKS